MNKFHQNFNFIISKNKVNLSELARNINVTRQAINEYKNGKYPTYDNLIKLAQYFNVSLDELLLKDLTSPE